MSAVPKKKLCWNCEGSVSREIDNCPYCGVYVHTAELENQSGWNSRRYQESKTEEIPSPLYSLQAETELSNDDNDHQENETGTLPLSLIWQRLKLDLFPALFLMMGSVFLLFGLILSLFSQNGTLTLQWKSAYSYYFLFIALPFLAMGWHYLQQLTPEDES